MALQNFNMWNLLHQSLVKCPHLSHFRPILSIFDRWINLPFYQVSLLFAKIQRFLDNYLRKKEIKLPLFNQCNDLITVLHYIDEHFCHFFLHNLLGSQIKSTLARTLISHLFSFPLSFKFQWTPYSTSSNDSQYSPTHEWCLKVEIAN